MTVLETEPEAAAPARSGFRIRRVLVVLFLFVLVYAAFAIWSGLGKIEAGLSHFEWWTFGAAISLAFGNYLLRFFKSFVLFETHGVPMPKTAPIVIAERITDLIGVIVLIVIGSLGFHGGLIPASVGAGIVVIALAIIASRRASFAVIGLVARLPGPFRRIAPRLEEAYEHLAMLVAPRNLWWPTLLSIAAWSLECLALAVILRGFAQQVPIALSIFFYATSTLAGAVIPVPGGLGVTEAGLREQMTNVGHIDEGTSTAAMMLVRFATLWFAVLVGFVALGILKRRYPKLLANG